MKPTPRRPRRPAADEAAASLHRSGAVARMLRMPVATLRVWERRYALTQAALSPSGQRLYSAADVRRLALIKQLTELGHAIGSLAPLGAAALERVAATHAQVLAAAPAGRRAAPAPRAWRLLVVGPALGARLRRPALLRALGRPVELLGPFADLAQAAAAMAADATPTDAWLLQLPQLHEGSLAEIAAALSPPARRKGRAAPTAALPVPVAVAYGFAPDAVCEALAAGGVTLLREPQPDVALAQWLRGWAAAQPAPAPGAARARAAAAPAPPRRWDDAALADFASLSSTVACECPRHVAELLVQLSRFEAYSAQCGQRHPGDGELHAFLGRVAAEARAGFEAALEQIALREGLLLPPPAA